MGCWALGGYVLYWVPFCFSPAATIHVINTVVNVWRISHWATIFLFPIPVPHSAHVMMNWEPAVTGCVWAVAFISANLNVVNNRLGCWETSESLPLRCQVFEFVCVNKGVTAKRSLHSPAKANSRLLTVWVQNQNQNQNQKSFNVPQTGKFVCHSSDRILQKQKHIIRTGTIEKNKQWN